MGSTKKLQVQSPLSAVTIAFYDGIDFTVSERWEEMNLLFIKLRIFQWTSNHPYTICEADLFPTAIGRHVLGQNDLAFIPVLKEFVIAWVG